MVTSVPQLREFNLVLPDQFVQIPRGELTEQGLRALAGEIAGVFQVPELDTGAVAAAITLASVGAGVAAGGASHVSAGVFKSTDGQRPILVLLSAYVMPSDHASVQAAISGLLEIHESQQSGLVRTVHLDSGPAVTVESREDSEIKIGEPEETYGISQHALTAWLPDEDGTTLVALSVMSTNTEDWADVKDLAEGIFDGFFWQPRGSADD
ncbi:hypothetical protein DMH04_24825 [Kibdelosporangium aridum]|uniref:Uncharacterized protein n=1 Tax=Kibdelosporangium aridum TaxID=2030 RepID=A0A428Z6K1_KIBAR|nr:hypothetical protein [Kibdelosporangium aridum]RSM82833.1 hypothetical protein DMH04_24825 [Kibdelosporangium aridum]